MRCARVSAVFLVAWRTDMTYQQRDISDTSALLEAVNDAGVRHIHVLSTLADVPAFHLLPGQTLSGADKNTAIRFQPGSNGVTLMRDNCITQLTLVTDPDKAAICNDSSVDQLGRLVLQDLKVAGRVELLAQRSVRSGHVDVHGLDVEYADARGGKNRPKGFGVEVVPGAFTLWNQQPEASIAITADLTDISIGRAGAPVRGSGIFVSGAGDTGGRMIVHRLETGPVYSDGGIAAGTPDRISAGVFVVYGARVSRVCNKGPVTTYGSNDMVLDNWGSVDQWVAHESITSYGPSSIGFVNFGSLDTLVLHAPIETFGQGSRGFNVYAGTVRNAEFDRITTHADGAVGIQLSQPVGTITVHRGIETFGGIGDSLVKGVVVKLAAHALSIKPGGTVAVLRIDGGLRSHGMGVDPLDMHGSIHWWQVSGGMQSSSSANTTP
jgi:hypothetical protein